MSARKPPAKPVWYKNTYFWISAVLLVLSLVGLVGGQELIRDPGQKKEGGLVVFYLIAAVVMLVNGWISHRQTVRHYEEEAQSFDA